MEEHRESEPPKMEASKGREGKPEARKVAETSSSGTSEGKSESSSRVTRSSKSSETSGATSVSKKSESASSASAKAPAPMKKGAVPKAPAQSKKKDVSKGTTPSKKGDVPKGTSPSKTRTSPKGTVSSIIGSFAKWASPPKKKNVKGSGSSTESDESPDKKERPATVSGGKKLKNKIKNVSNILFGKHSKPSHSEEVHLIQPEAESRPEEYQASKQTELVSEQTDPETWTPKHVEITGQINLNLRGQLTASYETLHPTKTDTSSLSGSVSIEAERASSLPLDRVDSHEGSTGDASSLERDFEELSSPSKSIQGLKRFQYPIEEEEEDAIESCSSPRKIRLMSLDKNPTEKPSDIEMN